MIELKTHKDKPSLHTFGIEKSNEGQRLDAFLALKLQDDVLSRSRIKSLLSDGFVLLNGIPAKPAARLRSGDRLQVTIPQLASVALIPEQLELNVLFEDQDLIVISKPPGLVVHPGAGHQTSTLVHGLLFHCDDLSGISGEERPGIVHRLDKDTSGVMVAAKNDQAHQGLVDQFKGREVTKIYRAIVCGVPAAKKGRIDLPIGRHKTNRRKMAVREKDGRQAATNWQVLEEFSENFAYVELLLESGRTHQIRVHMAAIGHPVVGDELYGGKCRPNIDPDLIKRQCLHSYRLGFTHPVSGRSLEFKAELWPDMNRVLEKFRQNSDGCK
ncbi:MAG: RluA family pseudouridine synthase [Proteobacteria bacterium]|nr:RluA family pseudouridine synthase [Pseudomonadota bacterium]MBU1739243.1 RluA family pseudouridine synthase [Pseudomonadota bacterium]